MYKIIYFGTPEFSADILEDLIQRIRESENQRFVIKAVITSPDKPVGRKQLISASQVGEVAEKNGILTLKPEKLSNQFLEENIEALQADLYIVAAYGKIIPQKLLDLPKFGAINVHPSNLPKYRGATPIQSAILNGEKETGVTIMLMDAEVDHGNILANKRLAISDKDNYQTLSKKLSQLSTEILLPTVKKYISGEIQSQIQDHQKATFTKIIAKEDGYFDIETPPSAEILDRMIRAFFPWPTAWTKWSLDKTRDKQGKVVKFYPDGLIQIEGKRSIPIKEFLHGYPTFPLANLLIV